MLITAIYAHFVYTHQIENIDLCRIYTLVYTRQVENISLCRVCTVGVYAQT